MDNTIKDEVIIALADLSGSMAGQSIAKINVQMAEMLAELQSIQEMASNSIRLGIMGFHETQQWILKPQEVNSIAGIPHLMPVYGTDQLGKKSSYARMLDELNKCLTVEFLCKSRILNSVHLLLFTDGYPTDRKDVLDKAMEELKKNKVFNSEHAKRYVIQEREVARFRECDDFFNKFAGSALNVVSSDDYSGTLSDITGSLSGISQISSVFG